MARNANASLAVRIGADTTDLRNGVRGATTSLQRFASVGKTAGLAVAGAVAAAGAAIAAMALKGVQLGDALAKTAQQVGLTSEELSGLRFAAQQSGIESGNLDNALKRLGKTVSDAKIGLSTARRALDELNLSASELERLPLSEQMLRVGEAMSGVTNQTDRLRIASDIFGKGAGADLLVMFEQGTDAIREQMEESKRYGNYLDATQARVVQEAADAQGRLKTAVQGLALQLGASLGPAIEKVSNVLAKMIGYVTTTVLPKLLAIIERITGIKRSIEDLSNVEVDIRLDGARKELRSINEELSDMFLEQLRRQEEYNEKLQIFGEGHAQVGIAAMRLNAIRDEYNKKLDEQAAKERDISAILAERRSRIDADESNAIDEAEEATKSYMETLREQIAQQKTAVETEVLLFDVFKRSEELKTQKLKEELEERAAAHRKASEELVTNLLIEVEEIEKAEEAKRNARRRTAESAIQSLVQMTAGVAQHSKKMFQLNKLASVASAVMNTAQGVTKALSEYPPPLSFAMAAAQAAAGLAQVQAIKSTTFQGGGRGTTPSAAGSTPTVNGHPTQTIHIKGVSADSLFTGRQVVDLFNEAVKDGARVVFA